jgi:hypothetical protein
MIRRKEPRALTAKIVDIRITIANPEDFPVGSVIAVGDARFWVESIDLPSSSLRLFPEPTEETARASEFEVDRPARSTFWRDVAVIVLIVILVKLVL